MVSRMEQGTRVPTFSSSFFFNEPKFSIVENRGSIYYPLAKINPTVMFSSPKVGGEPFNRERNPRGWGAGEDRRKGSVKGFDARASNVVSPVLVMKNIITPARISHALCTSCSGMPRPRIRTYVSSREEIQSQ